MTAVSLSRVTKVFPGRGRWNLFAPSAPAVAALGEISLEVPEGEIVGLLGRNGAGKTTLLRILAGYLYADSGEVTVLGRRLPEEESALKGAVIYVGPEERSFFFRLTVRQNLDLFLRLHGLRDREAAMGPWLDLFGMRPFMHRRFDSLSTGQRQKIALVRAFSTGAKLILFDEPFRSLDDEGIEKLSEALERLAGPVTFIIASPQEHPLLKRCTRVVKIG